MLHEEPFARSTQPSHGNYLMKLTRSDSRRFAFSRRRLALLTAISLAALSELFAAVPAARPFLSPEVHPDRTVTFRIFAPKATEVTLEGGWMASNATVPLIKDEKGLWSVTVGPLNPPVYAYWFNLDGASSTDRIHRLEPPRALVRAVG